MQEDVRILGDWVLFLHSELPSLGNVPIVGLDASCPLAPSWNVLGPLSLEWDRDHRADAET